VHPTLSCPAKHGVQGLWTHASVRPVPLPEKYLLAPKPVQLVQVPDVLNTHPALYWYGWQPEAVHGLMAQVLR
jgi:hypothetical protein